MIKKIHRRLQKYSRREFRPFYIFDIPVYFYRLYLSLKARNLVFFSNVNPCMTFSGFAGYGKYNETVKFDDTLEPKTILISVQDTFDDTEKKFRQSGIAYPYIAKPNFGRTGRGIQKIHNPEELKHYMKQIKEDFLIQEFINYPLEFGVTYYRMPGEKTGHITGIVEKGFMFIQGDSQSTLEKLILKHPRAKHYYQLLQQTHQEKRNDVLPQGTILQLNYIGNHCRGSVFYDRSDLITPQLEEVFDAISGQIPGFHFGRYDFKVQSIEDLYKGKIKIIELNGMGTLPTHIYDPKHTIRFAYKELFRHRDIVYRISKANRKRGIHPLSLKEARVITKKYGI